MTKANLLVLFILSSIYSFTQPSFGIKAGINVNDYMPKNLPSTVEDFTKMNIGFHFGTYTSIPISNNFSFKPELLFILKGGTFDETNSRRINLYYFELPLMISYSFLNKLDFEIGPSIEYNISSVTTYKDINYRSKGFIDNKFDFGFSAGLRARLIENIYMVARYYYGINTISEVYVGIDQELVTFHNRNIYFGLEFKLK